MFRYTIRRRPRPAQMLAALCLFTILPVVSHIAAQQPAAGTASSAPAGAAAGTPFAADQLSKMLPPSVYFQGKSAPVQTRNAGGTTFGQDAIVWAALVDSSGYSTAIQEKYQFYLVTESPVRFGGVLVPAGAYGGGFLADHFLLMDLGGHTVAQGALTTDAALRRPRPLQVLADKPNTVRLYLGRRWVAIEAAPSR